MKRVDATEARKIFSDILNWVCFGNETIVVTRHGRDIAAVVPVNKALPPLEVEAKKPSSVLVQTSRNRRRA